MVEEKQSAYQVLPQSVYVWRGFKNPDKSYAEFAGFLGSVFVPACALLQPRVGLRAYIPTLVPQGNKPPGIPDQTALMFWTRPDSHDLANTTVAVRAYQHLHGQLYDMTRSHHQEVPDPFPTTVEEMVDEQPYYLMTEEADWMYGYVQHTIASRSKATDPVTFRHRLFEWADAFADNYNEVFDAALFVINPDSVLLWLHSSSETVEIDCLQPIRDALDIHLQLQPKSMHLDHGLWNKWSGIDYGDSQNTSLNIQFVRVENTNPD